MKPKPKPKPRRLNAKKGLFMKLLQDWQLQLAVGGVAAAVLAIVFISIYGWPSLKLQ